jgi:hypothetical protein
VRERQNSVYVYNLMRNIFRNFYVQLPVRELFFVAIQDIAYEKPDILHRLQWAKFDTDLSVRRRVE